MNSTAHGDLLRKDARVYTAPALAKGLLIVEALATQDGRALSLGELAILTRHSVGEIYRVVQVLTRRGYLQEVAADQRYRLTPKMFELALQSDRYDRVVRISKPAMEKLTDEVGQSSYLSILSAGKVVVIASVETPGAYAFGIRPGSSCSPMDCCAGKLICAFSRHSISLEMQKTLTDRYGQDLSKAVRQMALMETSSLSQSVTDISVPIFDGDKVEAALTIPYLKPSSGVSEQTCLRRLKTTARAVSESLSKIH